MDAQNSQPSPEQLSFSFQGHAERLIGPHKQALKECVMLAWKMWLHELESNPAYFFPLSNRSRANLVNDHICQNIFTDFLGKPGISMSKKCGFLVMGIDEEINLRFKKVDSRLRHSNIPTTQQQHFDLQMPIPGLPAKAPTVIVGYLLDVSQSDIQNIVITFRCQGQLIWHFSIFEEQDGSRNADTNTVLLPIAPVGPVQPPKVKPKKSAEQDKEASGQ